MDITVLQKRIQAGDQKVFLDLSDEYGWTLYSYLSQRIRNPVLVKHAYEQILKKFYLNIQHTDQQGSAETVLLLLADAYCVELPPQTEAVQSPSGFGFWVALILLILLNGLCLWIIGGILMEMGMIPLFDLGYSWIRTLLSI